MRIAIFEKNGVVGIYEVDDDYVLPSDTSVLTITFRKEHNNVKLDALHSVLLINDEQYSHDYECKCSSRLEYPELECVKKRERMKLYPHPSDVCQPSEAEFSLDEWKGCRDCRDDKMRTAGDLYHVEVSSDEGVNLYFRNGRVCPIYTVARDVRIPPEYGIPRYAIFYGFTYPRIYVLMNNGDIVYTVISSIFSDVKDIFMYVKVVKASEFPCHPEQFGIVNYFETVTCAGAFYTSRTGESVELTKVEIDMRCLGHSSMVRLERMMSNKSARN